MFNELENYQNFHIHNVLPTTQFREKGNYAATALENLQLKSTVCCFSTTKERHNQETHPLDGTSVLELPSAIRAI